MNVLLIGWRRPRARARLEAQAKPPARSALLRTWQCGYRGARRMRRARCGDHDAVARFCKEKQHRPRRHRSGSAARRRPRRRSRGARHQSVRAVARGGTARRLQGLHQGSLRAGRNSDRCLSPASPMRMRPRPMSRARPLPDRHQGRWARRRQGRDHRRDGGRGARRDRCLLRRRLRRGGRGSGDRGVPARRGGELLRPGRWHDGAAACHRAGPQARFRRRSGTEYRRHGRLFAGADHDGRAVPPRS